ncbi:thiamine diphosphokinase [Devosia rhodophyticola]|uniref:Thiamine diphosphokinase n=1 Tax=Devosia rhodophyticola TaxID=3026423 RepID=A0ABY7YUT9_9HYPH|nr:thiamine diphosphokinase [Devosia rhodophyticola]WDR04947.1 thiamine diphosphokinase [Devosia rhodophyticola]
MQDTLQKTQDVLPIVFSGTLAIVGGGTVAPSILRDLHLRGVALVGADGGGDVIGAAGLVPAAIIGDLDSLKDRPGWEKRTQVVEIAEQITTDFEKSVYSTQAPVTLAVGMTGKRFDHTMAALHVVAKFATRRRIILIDEHDIAMAVSGPLRFDAAAGERVSMHPLGAVRISRSKGLFYALDGLTLAPGELTGVSNAALGGEIIVEPVAGEMTPWLLILDKKRLWDLVALPALNK